MKALLILAAALVATAAVGAPGKSKTKQAPPASAKTMDVAQLYATAPIDPGAEALPASYAGHDCRAVATAVKRLNLAKDEYETTAAHEARTAAVVARPIAGTTTLADHVGFVQEYAGVIAKYDADSGALRLSGYAISSLTSTKPGFAQAVLVKTDLVSESTYSASNAYGKTVEVRKRTLYGCMLALPQLKYGSRLPDFDATIELPADEARKAKENIGVLYVGTLAAPYWAEYVDHSAPTIDSPSEAYWKGDTLILRNAERWIFDKATGRIYQKSKL